MKLNHVRSSPHMDCLAPSEPLNPLPLVSRKAFNLRPTNNRSQGLVPIQSTKKTFPVALAKKTTCSLSNAHSAHSAIYRHQLCKSSSSQLPSRLLLIHSKPPPPRQNTIPFISTPTVHCPNPTWQAVVASPYHRHHSFLKASRPAHHPPPHPRISLAAKRRAFGRTARREAG